MNHIFVPNHVQLLNTCYPPASALLTAGPDYAPNSQELSKLTYYASNHPAKLTKLGSELEKRLRGECRKAQAGNVRSRASLLITLAIFRALATECRRDIALITPPLVCSVDATLSACPKDLEVSARAASVFTAWTTYTDGHLVGADAGFTNNYLSVLRRFATLASSDITDPEVCHRTRLVGFAAVAGAINSNALYNDSGQFRRQIAIMIRPILHTLFEAELSVLEEQMKTAKDTTASQYLDELRRPIFERRAMSVHVHVDGENGPSISDVVEPCLRGLHSLMEHFNGSQLGYTMRSTLEKMDELNCWPRIEHCSWLASKMAEWAQYQYRYAVPAWLVERLLESQDDTTTPPGATALPIHRALVTMITKVFSSPTPLVNLSTSDIISNLTTFLLRRTSIDPHSPLLSDMVDCIVSLGCHVYYADQIQDLAAELISRLSVVEVQGVLGPSISQNAATRSPAIRCLLAGLIGLINAADKNKPLRVHGELHKISISVSRPSRTSHDSTPRDAREKLARRNRVPPNVWQDTLSLLCDSDYAVRADCAEALILYIVNEMPKDEDAIDAEGVRRVQKLSDSPLQKAATVAAAYHSGDSAKKFFQSIYSYLYILATAPLDSAPSSSSAIPETGLIDTSMSEKDGDDYVSMSRRSAGTAPRSRKQSVVLRLLQNVPLRVSPASAAHLSDYSNIFAILKVMHEQLPIRALLTGLPFLLALDRATQVPEDSHALVLMRSSALRIVVTKVWALIGRIWESSEITAMVDKVVLASPPAFQLPKTPKTDIGLYHAPRIPVEFDKNNTAHAKLQESIDSEAALRALAVSCNVQDVTGVDEETMLRKCSVKWTADLGFGLPEKTPKEAGQGDAVTPLLRISPALMRIDNMSLASLARPTKSFGVTDLREALEGRSSLSNPALNKASSVSTMDQASSVNGGELRASPGRARTGSRITKHPLTASSDVRDVLNRLGIGKQNGSLAKSPPRKSIS
ncbi:hypothetical protein FISHEDRAFT_72688 [Fistulina hepatica ATCC 64428]|nr:hypothetical protein FISHEDRAFT_72688 [Fistulina hepatica ATCC 64428]